jgi:ubiquinone/menaquinone biosynthesis C-methylase UbiE
MGIKSERDFFEEEYSNRRREKAVGQIYSITGNRLRAFEKLIFADLSGLRVLEYGCGERSLAFEMAQKGAQVVGIDISEVGIRNLNEKASEAGTTGTEFLVMNALDMSFPDESFDLVVGEGILHHLDLETAYREIARVLKPGGRAVFMEPLGHNPAMELFRKLTPSLRTPDEHPLLRSDLRLAGRFFESTSFQYFHLASFASLALLKTNLFWPSLRVLDRLDAVLFRMPGLGLLSWYCIMIMNRPRNRTVS